MAYDANVLRRATERLDRERRERQERTERLRALAYSRQPALEKLDRELQGTMAQLVAAALRQGEDPAQAVRQVRDHNLALQRERAGLLAGLGLAEDILDFLDQMWDDDPPEEEEEAEHAPGEQEE